MSHLLRTRRLYGSLNPQIRNNVLYRTQHRHNICAGTASERIRKLYGDTDVQADTLIDEALNLYQNEEHKDVALLDSMLKLLLKQRCPSQALVLWDDIDSIINSRSAPTNSLVHSLTECCIKTYDLNIFQCIKVAQWIQEYSEHRRFQSILDSFILKLISKYKHQKDAIDLINNHLNNKTIFIRNGRAVKTALINAYSRCHDLDRALFLFDSIEKKDSVSINAMITAFQNNDHYQEALNLYHDNHSFHDTVSHILALKSCTNLNAFDIGINIHYQTPIAVDDRNYIEYQNTLISFYGHFRTIETVWSIFRMIPIHKMNGGTLNAMMKSLITNDRVESALGIYETEHSLQNDTSHMLAIKACIKCEDWKRGRRIHQNLKGMKLSHYTLTELITFYGRCRDMKESMNIFQSIPMHKISSTSVSALMNVLLDNGDYQQCFAIYHEYSEKVQVDDVMRLLALKGCIKLKKEEKGNSIITEMKEENDEMNKISLNLKNTVMDFHGTFGHLDVMKKVFYNGDVDSGSLNVMMKWLIANGFYDEALHFYTQHESLHDITSIVYALEGCIQTNDEERGNDIISDFRKPDHVDLEKMIPLIPSHFTTKLIDFYGHFGDLSKALEKFHDVPSGKRNSVMINAMMTVFMKHQMFEGALGVYDDNPLHRDDVTRTMAINICTNSNNEERGRQVISEMSFGKAFTKTRTVSFYYAVIEFYGHFGDVDAAEDIFNQIQPESIHVRVVEMMLNIFIAHKMNQKCIDLFEWIRSRSELEVSLNGRCYELVFKACGDHLGYGQRLHEELVCDDDDDDAECEQNKVILSEVSVQIALISMYGKAGRIDKCEEIFDHMSRYHEWDIRVWNAMIDVYGRNGNIEKLRECYGELRELKMNGTLNPDKHTFVALLGGLGHCGEMDQAMEIWNDDIDDEEIKYDLYVVTSLVDGLARKGLLFEARDLVLKYEKENCL